MASLSSEIRNQDEAEFKEDWRKFVDCFFKKTVVNMLKLKWL